MSKRQSPSPNTRSPAAAAVGKHDDMIKVHDVMSQNRSMARLDQSRGAISKKLISQEEVVAVNGARVIDDNSTLSRSMFKSKVSEPARYSITPGSPSI